MSAQGWRRRSASGLARTSTWVIAYCMPCGGARCIANAMAAGPAFCLCLLVSASVEPTHSSGGCCVLTVGDVCSRQSSSHMYDAGTSSVRNTNLAHSRPTLVAVAAMWNFGRACHVWPRLGRNVLTPADFGANVARKRRHFGSTTSGLRPNSTGFEPISRNFRNSTLSELGPARP